MLVAHFLAKYCRNECALRKKYVPAVATVPVARLITITTMCKQLGTGWMALSCIVGVTPGSVAGCQVAFRAPGCAQRLRSGCGRSALLLLSLVSGRRLMLLFRSHSGLFGAVCCFISATPVRVGCFLPLIAAWGLVRVLPFCVVRRARGTALRLRVCLLGFPAGACTVTPVAIVASLCNTLAYLLHNHARCLFLFTSWC